MILIGLGANLKSEQGGTPRQTLEAALGDLEAAGIAVVCRSRWYKSAPVPPSAQPWYVNGVVVAETALAPAELLAALHGIEAAFGRKRGEKGAARTLDLDLLDYAGVVSCGGKGGGDGPILPHPRLHERAFVLLPLAEVAPDWCHPVSGKRVDELIAELSAGQTARPIDDDG